MLTARGEEQDKVSGLETGADDYITKPFSTSSWPVSKTVLRRRAPRRPDPVSMGGLTLDPATHRVSAGAAAQLGPTGFRLLHFLMTHPGQVYSGLSCSIQVLGDHVFVEERTVDVHIRRLRCSLQPTGHESLIRTVGNGYRLSVQQDAPATVR